MGLQGCEMCKLRIILLVWLPNKRGCTRTHFINKALYVSAMQDAVVKVGTSEKLMNYKERSLSIIVNYSPVPINFLQLFTMRFFKILS